MTPTGLHFDPGLMIQSSCLLSKLWLKTRPLAKRWVCSPVFGTPWEPGLWLKMSLTSCHWQELQTVLASRLEFVGWTQTKPRSGEVQQPRQPRLQHFITCRKCDSYFCSERLPTHKLWRRNHSVCSFQVQLLGNKSGRALKPEREGKMKLIQV